MHFSIFQLQRTGVQGIKAESGQSALSEGDTQSIVNIGPGGFSKTLRSYLGDNGKPRSPPESSPASTALQIQLLPCIVPTAVTQDTSGFGPPLASVHGSPSCLHKTHKTREPDIAEFILADSYFSSCCPSFFSLNSRLMCDVLFFHLKMLQLNTCMVAMTTIR